MRIVVTGGSGDLGGRVVRQIEARGHEAVPASRRTGVDLATGVGLDAVLAGADAVIHSASSQTRPQDVDVAGARRIGESLRRLGSGAHVVSISIVGSDRVPYPYYRAKVDSERALEDAALPATVLRATQFHSLAAFLATAGRVGPLAFSVGDMRIQPVDIDWVAQRLTDYATGPAPSGYRRARDIAGPAAYSAVQLAAILAAHDGRRPPRVVRIPPLLPVLRGFAEGGILPGPDAETGGRSFKDWLDDQPTPMPRRFHSPT
ncbi:MULTISPECIES: SDR family oxidoreductase [unclassified Knoellia]|uniref:SDR family oxidoreductase n=1 Tax=Knoellia altitudinis TaxID=3404795 RepID=UPI0036214030